MELILEAVLRGESIGEKRLNGQKNLMEQGPLKTDLLLRM